MKFRIRALVSLFAVAVMCNAAFAVSNQQHRGFERFAQKLHLSSDQQSQIKPIFDTHRSQMKARFEAMRAQFRSLLTPAQQAQLDQRRAERQANAGTSGREGRARLALNLTDDQKAQVRAMFKQQRSQIRADQKAFAGQVAPLLNAGQKAKFEHMMRHHGRRHHHHGRNRAAARCGC